MTTKERAFAIPVIMTRAGEHYLISCSSLGIYVQDDSEQKAEERFKECVNALISRMIAKGTFWDFISKRALVEDKTAIKSSGKPSFTFPKLQLGNHASLEVGLCA